MRFNKKPNSIINTEERNSRFGTFFLLFFGMFVLFAGIAVAVLVPYISSLPIYVYPRAVYSLSYITEETSLDEKHHLVLTTKGKETLTFTTDNEEYSFVNEDPTYIFGDKAGEDSNISLIFMTEGDYKVNSVDLYICSETGDEITLVQSKLLLIEVEEDKSTVITYSSNSDIFIYSVAISYQLRIR